ncbi:MAG: response regulator [Candidatus Sungbacteria bacterium]|nr:response regulator [Candidatus Sungbacteria bacterium]
MYKILIIEDDAFLRKLLAEKLAREGFQVKETAGGKDAMEHLAQEVPHAVLLDLVMPGVDGFQILQEIRKNPASKNIPVIVLSNLGEQEHVDRARSLGADDYLIKAHFILDEIVERVSALIAKRYV